MKRLLIVLAAIIVLSSCGNGGRTTKLTTKSTVEKKDVVEVIYFHGKKRCISCNAIENLAKEVVDSLNNPKIVMKIVDISQKNNKEIADKYEVTWSSLILDKDGKLENLTNLGFGYAKNQPAVFKQKLVESLNEMLK